MTYRIREQRTTNQNILEFTVAFNASALRRLLFTLRLGKKKN